MATYVVPSAWVSSNDNTDVLLDMGSLGHYVLDAKQHETWSFYSPDNNDLRFEVRSGDRWVNDPAGLERCEIGGLTPYAYGTAMKVSYNFELEAGPPITSAFCVVGQIHQTDYFGETPYSPPVAICMVGSKMGVQVNWVDQAGIGVQHTKMIFTDTVDLNRGQVYAMEIICNMVVAPVLNGAKGQLVVKRNGATLVTYTGPLGIPRPPDKPQSVFWKEGIYRAASPETLAAHFIGTAIVTGSQAGLISAMTPALAAGVVSSFNVYNSAGQIIKNEIYKSDTTTEDFLHNTSPSYFLAEHLWYGPYIDAAHPPALVQDFQYNSNTKLHFTQTITPGYIDIVNYDTLSPPTGTVVTTSRNYTSGANAGVTSTSHYLAGVLNEKYVSRPDGTSTDDYYGPNGVILSEINTAANGFKVKWDFTAGTPYQKSTTFTATGQTATADGVSNFVHGWSGGGDIIEAYLGMGHMNVANFHAGSAYDRLRFPSSYVSSPSGLTIAPTAAGASTLITVNAHPGDTIQLNGVTPSSFNTLNNLIFAV